MMTMQHRRHRGVTLLELAIALAVIAVLGALALPSLGARLDQQRLSGAAEALLADLSEARFEAARQHRSLHLVTQTGDNWCWAVALDPGCPCGQAQACELRHAMHKDHTGVRLVEAQALSLNANGTAGTAASATLESRRGVRLRVDLQALGRARICAPAGAAPPNSRYPPC